MNIREDFKKEFLNLGELLMILASAVTVLGEEK